MKKILGMFAVGLVLTTSIIAGTLAMYTTSIDNIAEGSVVAKEFVLLKGGTDTFTQNVKIAPSETNTWQFSVKNHNGAVVSETAMDLSFHVDVRAANDKSAIEPLVIMISDEQGNQVGTVTGSGTIEFADGFALEAAGQEKVYTVTVNWPSDDQIDIDYAGNGFGTAVEVSVTGTQA